MDLSDGITQVESSGDPKKPNPNSSALGLGQFVNRTWLDMIRRYRPDKAQGKSDAEILELRKDPVLSREMTARYAEENEANLRHAGLPVTPGSIYLMHFAGPGGGVALMKADPNAPVESILDSQAVKANPFLRGKTASWVIDWANEKMAKAAASKSPVVPQPSWGKGKPIPYLAETEAAEPVFGATGWPPRPASPNVWPADGANPMFGGRTSAPVPYLDETNKAERQLQNVPSQGLPPAAFNGRFNQAPLNSADVDHLLAALDGGRQSDKTKPNLEPPQAFSDRFGGWNTFNGASGPTRTSGSILGQTSDDNRLGPRAPAPLRAAPAAAPALPSLRFAPETPRNSGPFTAAPLSFGASDGPGAVQKPGGLLGMMIDAGVMPWNPNEFASAPIQSPGLVEKWMRVRPHTPGAPLRVSAADPDQPFGTHGQFARDSAAPSQPLYDSYSFAAPAAGSTGADDPRNIRILRSYTRARDGSMVPSLPRTSSQPQDTPPIGLVSGMPMTDYSLASIFGTLDRPATSDDGDDFFSRWIKPLFQQ